MAAFLRKRAKGDELDRLTSRLSQLDSDLMAVCCQPSNPLTLHAADEVFRLHRKLRRLRNLIEIEAGKC